MQRNRLRSYGMGLGNGLGMVLTDPGGLPVLGTDCWQNGWLPSTYQGTVVRPKEPRILNLDAPARFAGEPQRRYLEYLQGINTRHLAQRPGELDLAARIATYELAARMQTSAKEALDLNQETAATRREYGLEEDETREFGSRCLIARRLVERGVRFVQLYTSTQQWDHHGGIEKALPKSCRKIDRPSAALAAVLRPATFMVRQMSLAIKRLRTSSVTLIFMRR